MAVQVASRVDMSEANRLPTPHGGPTVTRGAARPTDAPVAVTVPLHRDAGYRLLSTTCLTHRGTDAGHQHNTHLYCNIKKGELIINSKI